MSEQMPLPKGADYDLVVVGAGIQGAGVAQAAAAQGWSVLVIERHDRAGLETSSASSKLIHGGLRYLESGQLRLVYECLRERALLLRNAPDLVKIQPFYLPIYRHSSRRPAWIRLGLILYSLLGGLTAHARHHRIAREQWPSLAIKTENLLAVYRYYDAQTNDRLLTQAVLSSAQSFGAKVSFGTQIKTCEKREAFYLQLSDGKRVRTRALVNAAGPWVNEVAKLIPGVSQTPLEWVQGTHIILPVQLPGCFYLESPSDRRAVFALPWQGQAMVGTTETRLEQAEASPLPEEVDYLLEVFNHYFPTMACTLGQVVSKFSGVRVLPLAAREGSLNRRSRETLLVTSRFEDSVYLAVYGGKLTSYRASAEKVVTRLAEVLGRPPRKADTAKVALTLNKLTPTQ